MNTKILNTCAAGALLLNALSSQARNIPSPDGRFAIRAESAIELLDSAGKPMLDLNKHTAGDTKVEVAWSADSRRLAIVETSGRGSDIVAAWRDGEVWHKTIEMDADQAGMIQQAQREFGGRLVSERRTLGSWISGNAVKVHGEMTFTGGRKCAFAYTLEFGHGPIHLSRAGYEDGAVVGTQFQIL